MVEIQLAALARSSFTTSAALPSEVASGREKEAAAALDACTPSW